ncbi:MAG: helix-turn-helix domain-containing protein [Candidatus Bathyarchaeota archaeon]|nr:helix-turn-helix domain-containing protein [Candidatus Bathyarchaeum tardum]
MNNPRNEVQTMTKLGLTSRQAIVYLWLTKSGIAPIKTISRGTKIARQHIYKITENLNQIGLVEKILDAPTKFKATPIEIGISILMENKNTEFTNLKTETTDLIKSVKKQTITSSVQDEKPEFVVVSGKALTLSKLHQGLGESQKAIDGIGAWIRIKKAFYNNYANIKKSLDKGIQIRQIIDTPPDKEQFKNELKEILEHPLYSIKCIPPPPPAILFLRDKKEAMISNSVASPEETPDLWVSNQHLVTILQDYFEMMWNKATEI